MITPRDTKSIAGILDFWFGHVEETIIPSERRVQLWFADNSEIDEEIITTFSDDMQRIIDGGCDHWRESARGQLAMIIVLDQFARHMYREQKEAYMHDEQALAICFEGLRANRDHELSLIERVFYYFPLLHSENRQYQQMSLENYELLAEMALPETKIVYDSFYKFSKHHWALIDRFGRFPQRNNLLQRTSTEEESLFLQKLEKKMQGE